MPFMPPAGYRWTDQTEIKRSRFITTLARTNSEAEARALIAEVRSCHHDARHHCVAYVLEDADGVRRAHSSDDGEPSGTGGIPMLNVLHQADLVNVTAVVTRYFGGILLGTGGLTRAYGGGVAGAVAVMPRVVRQWRQVWAVHLPYGEAGRLQQELLRDGASMVGLTPDETGVRLRLVFPDEDARAAVARATQGAVRPVMDGTDAVEVPVVSDP